MPIRPEWSVSHAPVGRAGSTARRTATVQVLPPDMSLHANMAEVREVLRVAFDWTPVELTLLGTARRDVPEVAPGGAPPWMVEHARLVAGCLSAHYAPAVEEGLVPQAGVFATADAITGAYLAPWITPNDRVALMAPYRAVFGPAHEAGMGSRHAQVARILLNAHGADRERVLAVSRQSNGEQSRRQAAGVEAAAYATGRSTSLRLVEESLAVLTEGLLADNVSEQSRLSFARQAANTAGAVIVRDAIPTADYAAAVALWRTYFPVAL